MSSSLPINSHNAQPRRLSLLGFLLLLLSSCLPAAAQQYVGTPGLLHAPSAEMDTAGVARIGAHYMPREMMPDNMKVDGHKYNSLTNYLSITPFKWIEVGYGYTLMKMHQNTNVNRKLGFYSKDRYFSVRINPLYEGKYWPAVVVGGNDVWGSGEKGVSASNYMKNYYAAASKHFSVYDQQLGLHLSYRWYLRDFNKKYQGVVGGLTLRPSFYRDLRIVADYDGVGANIGADCRLFKYFMVEASLNHGKVFTGGLSLYLNLL